MEDLSYVDQDAPVEYPIELGKTLLSLVFLGLGFLVTTFSLALTHEVCHHLLNQPYHVIVNLAIFRECQTDLRYPT